jgi:TRAP-type mannitol/chloroaromatic compound transport system permease small subunit
MLASAPVVERRYIIIRDWLAGNPAGFAGGPGIGENPSAATARRDLAPGSTMMKTLLTIARAIDALNERIGRTVIWLVLVMALVSSGNAMFRYLFNQSSNAWLELQWYLFAAVFLLCSGYTLLHNEHIRIDVVSSRLSARSRLWIDVFGTVLFLLPVSIFIVRLSWPVFVNAWASNEMSSNAGGLIRWPARLLVPVGFLLLSLQGFSELIKRIAALKGIIPDPTTPAPPPLVMPVDERLIR